MPHIHELFDFTVSAFIMHPSQPKLLLLHHKKIGKWLQPGGHVELNETPLQTLHHELQEETGLLPAAYTIIEPAEQPHPTGNNTVLPLPFYFNVHKFAPVPGHQHIDICYLVKSNTQEITTTPDGAHDIKWLTLKEIKDLHNKGQMFIDTMQISEWIFEKYY